MKSEDSVLPVEHQLVLTDWSHVPDILETMRPIIDQAGPENMRRVPMTCETFTENLSFLEKRVALVDRLEFPLDSETRTTSYHIGRALNWMDLNLAISRRVIESYKSSSSMAEYHAASEALNKAYQQFDKFKDALSTKWYGVTPSSGGFTRRNQPPLPLLHTVNVLYMNILEQFHVIPSLESHGQTVENKTMAARKFFQYVRKVLTRTTGAICAVIRTLSTEVRGYERATDRKAERTTKYTNTYPISTDWPWTLELAGTVKIELDFISRTLHSMELKKELSQVDVERGISDHQMCERHWTKLQELVTDIVAQEFPGEEPKTIFEWAENWASVPADFYNIPPPRLTFAVLVPTMTVPEDMEPVE